MVSQSEYDAVRKNLDRVRSQNSKLKNASEILESIVAIWSKHFSNALTQQEADDLCHLCDEYQKIASKSSFAWGDIPSTKQMAQLSPWYADVKSYCAQYEIDCSKFEKLIIEVLFPLGAWGENAQNEQLIKSANKRHHEKIRELLSRYEQIHGIQVQ